jgi:hypothetical protein
MHQLADELGRMAPAAAAELHNLADGLQRSAERLGMDILEVPPQGISQLLRYGTVCGRYRHGSNVRVSDLRLCGLWLKGAGFDIGQGYEVRVERNKLTIQPAARRRRAQRAAKPPRPPR